MSKSLLLVLTLLALQPLPCTAQPTSWQRHTIDASSRGADGVRLADWNGDGLPDFVTGWEEGGQVAMYLHPGSSAVQQPWPKTIVGDVRSAEDAFFADVDGDGSLDVVSCCEGKTRTVFVHRSNGPNGRWSTAPFPALENRAVWMFGAPLQVDGDGGVDLILGAKGTGAQIGWLRAPEHPRQLDQWTWHPFHEAGWIMSIVATDMNGDGQIDILYSDRKGDARGCHWLQNPAAGGMAAWPRHTLGGTDREVMFLAVGDVDGDGLDDVVCAVSKGDLLWLRRTDPDGLHWQQHTISMPPNTGTGKGVAVADVDHDGRSDVLFTCENAAGKHGVGWLSASGNPFSPNWTFHSISGIEGTKFDLIQMLDLDGDGDLDLVTCEERENLGVIWYENPCRN